MTTIEKLNRLKNMWNMNKNRSFGTNVKRFNYKVEDRSPGPGAYKNSHDMVWDYKSYNIMYSKD